MIARWKGAYTMHGVDLTAIESVADLHALIDDAHKETLQHWLNMDSRELRCLSLLQSISTALGA